MMNDSVYVWSLVRFIEYYSAWNIYGRHKFSCFDKKSKIEKKNYIFLIVLVLSYGVCKILYVQRLRNIECDCEFMTIESERDRTKNMCCENNNFHAESYFNLWTPAYWQLIPMLCSLICMTSRALQKKKRKSITRYHLRTNNVIDKRYKILYFIVQFVWMR